MSTPLITVSQQFKAMKIKDSGMKLGVPASEEDLETQFQHALFIESSLDKNKLTARDMANASSLQGFMKNHCHSSSYAFHSFSYAFQVKKCMDPAAARFYCNQHPVRLPMEQFLELNIYLSHY